MDRADVANFLVRAKEMRELADTIKSEQHRKLLLESAEKFERLANDALRSEPKR